MRNFLTRKQGNKKRGLDRFYYNRGVKKWAFKRQRTTQTTIQ